MTRTHDAIGPGGTCRPRSRRRAAARPAYAVVAAVAGLEITLAGCSGTVATTDAGTASPASSGSTGASSAAVANAPDPNAPEIVAAGDVPDSQVVVPVTPASAPFTVSVTEAVERYEFWKGGKEVILTLSGPKGSDNVDPWRAVTDSFRWQQ